MAALVCSQATAKQQGASLASRGGGAETPKNALQGQGIQGSDPRDSGSLRVRVISTATLVLDFNPKPP